MVRVLYPHHSSPYTQMKTDLVRLLSLFIQLERIQQDTPGEQARRISAGQAMKAYGDDFGPGAGGEIDLLWVPVVAAIWQRRRGAETAARSGVNHLDRKHAPALQLFGFRRITQ